MDWLLITSKRKPRKEISLRWGIMATPLCKVISALLSIRFLIPTMGGYFLDSTDSFLQNCEPSFVPVKKRAAILQSCGSRMLPSA
jgi:hypothetical protein